jgi:hypothetical protein
MWSMRLLFFFLAVTGCGDRRPEDRTRINGTEGRRPVVSTRIDPEETERRTAIRQAAYNAYKDRKDRIFGEAFDDVNWDGPPIRVMRRRSTGDFFRYVGWNGGYPSFFTLTHNRVSLRADVRILGSEAYPTEPIYVIGPTAVKTGPLQWTRRDWTSSELRVIASFFQTRSQEGRTDNIRSMRANGHHDMADARERSPINRTSVVFENDVPISSIANFSKP